MAKQFTDQPLLPAADANDIIPLRDVSAGVDKKTTVGGLAAGVAASFPGASVDTSALDWNTIPWGIATYSTFGNGGGQIVPVSSDSTLNFNVLETDSHVGISLPSNGQLEVADAGIYAITLNTRIIDSPQNANLQYIELSTNGGSTWSPVRGYTVHTNIIGTNTGLPTTAITVRLVAGTRIRARYRSDGGQTRVGATAVSQKYECSLSVARVA